MIDKHDYLKTIILAFVGAIVSFVVYFTTLRVIGVDLRALLRRSGHD
jgi:hypothetical protein